MNDTDVINVTVDRGQHTVLVVDDNDATRYSTARVLKAAGFRTDEAANGTEAIAKSASGVSAIVLDVNLPDMDGFHVCRVIRARPETEHIPVIHLSATHVASEDRITGLNAGADAYLVHPAEPAVVVATIQALIRARTAEEGLRRSEHRFRAIYDHAQSGIALLDVHGGFADANGAMLRLLGRPLKDVVGRPLASFAAPGFEASFPAHEASHVEMPVQHPDGRIAFLDWTISAPIGEGLRIATASDLSERHELEQRRREVLEREQAARAAAEQHSRTKDDFIAVLSHELRTPLNSIVGWVAILQRRDPTPEALKGLAAIERNVKAQARIISDILDVSRINSGKLRLERERVDPAEVVTNALTALQKDIDDRSIHVDVDFDCGNDPAWMDPNRFEQIVWNLMTNAVKFSPAGSRVDVRLRRERDTLQLVVRDFGQGVAAEFLPRLFDRFSQSDSPGNRHHGGLGLGLSIVKHLADLHGGRVSAFSAGPGTGATMQVDLPVFGSAFSAERPPDSELDDRSPDELQARPLENLDILVVEDDAGAAEMLCVVLADRGATVRSARDYDTALEALGASWPDALVSDIGLPGRDGYELIRAVNAMARQSGRRLPAVALTAFARPEDRSRAIDAGFDLHVAKPLKPHALVSALLSVTPSRRKPAA
ncbi:response regulator [Ramlibacter sp. PS4R-6]|uniref:response regulator n=1 Tax=Ramlibacter sp. PS4R-6 TaxID=3133438 RepID=UPI0030ADFDC2